MSTWNKFAVKFGMAFMGWKSSSSWKPPKPQQFTQKDSDTVLYLCSTFYQLVVCVAVCSITNRLFLASIFIANSNPSSRMFSCYRNLNSITVFCFLKVKLRKESWVLYPLRSPCCLPVFTCYLTCTMAWRIR